MKKAIYIVLAVFALGLASCSKQDIQPNSSSDTVVPVWKALDDGSASNPDPIGSGDGGITDPNLDPELESSGQ